MSYMSIGSGAMSLDDRERRARERAEQRWLKEERDKQKRSQRGPPSDNPAEAALAAMSAPVDPQATGKLSPPKPGASLFDNYANLADPVAFSTDEQEVEELLRLGVGLYGGGSSWEDERDKEENWDSSQHKSPPAYLKHIKPMTREPWTIDTAIYNEKFDTRDYGQPKRYDLRPSSPLAQYREEDPRKRPKGPSQEAWNSTPFRPTPHALKGIKPATTSKEPWVGDQRSREGSAFGDFENTNLIENDTLEELDNGGGFRFKNFSNYKNEKGNIGGKEMPAWNYSTFTWS